MRSMNSSAPARRAALTASLKVRPGRPAMMLSRIEPRHRKQKIVLQHHAEALPQMAQVDLAQIGAVDLDKAGVVAVDPCRSRAIVDLPEPLLPTMPSIEPAGTAKLT